MSKSKTITEQGLKIQRKFTKEGVNPLEEVEYETRSSKITEPDGTIVFEMDNIQAPKSWSQLAVDIAASKYFKRAQVPETGKETSVKNMVSRVSSGIRHFGEENNYFNTQEDTQAFEDELNYLLINQMGAFNSPVWFNCGLFQKYGIKGSKSGTYFYNLETDQVEECNDSYTHPQCSACQPYHALINTTKGLIPIGKIVEENLIGLEVFDGNGKTKVVAAKANGRKQVYRIKLKGGFFIDATSDHVVCSHKERRTKKLEWRKVHDLKIGDYMRIYTKSIPEDKIINIKLEAEAALAGWLQTDGFVGQYSKGTNRSLTIEFMTVNDDEFNWIISNLNIVLPDVHKKIRKVDSKDKNLKIKRIRLYGEILRPFIEKYDLLKRGKNMRMPNLIWSSSNRVIISYLKSLFQAEGYASIRSRDNNARIGLDMISKEFVYDIQTLLLRLGIYSRLIHKKEKRNNRSDTCSLSIGIGSERKRFIDTIGFIAPNKMHKAQQTILIKNQKNCPKIRYSQIISIKPLDTMNVYDIQTESSHYLTNSVLVHNCFIQKIEDSLKSIYDLVINEAKLFKFGSGTGTNFSSLRGVGEALSGGGVSSGLMSFLKILDRSAAAVKSGGITRRAAKMCVLDMDHPEIEDYILWKVKEEDKVQALIAAGYSSDFNSEAYQTVSGQNSNNSVMIPDKFMQSVIEDKEWRTTKRTTGETYKTYQARDLMKTISNSAWRCADPGVMFYDTMNKWHTCKNTDEIHSTNPCAEFLFIDDSACNLASLNLMKYINDDTFDIDSYRQACRIFFIAQEIIIDFASYPTSKIAKNSHDLRPIGLGHANLGTLLMTQGIPYDSEKGRAIASAISAVTTGHAYRTSSEIAKTKGTFEKFGENKEPMLNVMKMHREAAYKIDVRHCPSYLLDAAREGWDKVVESGEKYGFRNAQATAMAPTGTIGLLMDCDTTGIEPEFSLIKWKKLAGGGYFKIINKSTELALTKLSYTESERKEILEHISEKGNIEHAPHMKEEHLPIFDCANRNEGGSRYIEPMGHVKMMSSVQQFVSGAISKTVNLPNEATVEDIQKIYFEAWTLGLKGIALYRDGCKLSQPLNTKLENEKEEKTIMERGMQKRMPYKRKGITIASKVSGNKLFIRTGEYRDGKLGEVFIDMHKAGSSFRSLMNCFAIAVSMGLQYGVPLEKYVNLFTFTRFEPSGLTDHPNIRSTTSVIDFIFRVLGMEYLGRTDFVHIPPVVDQESASRKSEKEIEEKNKKDTQTKLPDESSSKEKHLSGLLGDAPLCDHCGHTTVRNGACYKCLNCGNSMGCS